MQISDKKAVAIDYNLTIDGGIVVDSSEPGQPLWYLHGASNIIPGLEKELTGLDVGAEKTVTVVPDEGYGVREDKLVQVVPKTQFDGQTHFQIGDRVVAEGPDGQKMNARISLIGDSEITVDFNHELAGKTLTFKIKVAEVRDASKEELDHGHVHGPGGHQH